MLIAAARPAMFTGTLVDLECLFQTWEQMRNYCLGLEDRGLCLYTDFLQTQKGCTSQGFVLTHSQKTNTETLADLHTDLKLRKKFIEVWNEFVDLREQRYRAAGISIDV